MTTRTRSSPAACWRQRFLAIARQAQAHEPRAVAPGGSGVRKRPGLLAGRHPGAGPGRP